MIHLDTSFVVDLIRESSGRKRGPATEFLENLPEQQVGVSVIVLCELHAGAQLSRQPARESAAVEQLSRSLRIEYPDERFAPTYGRLLAYVERAGKRIPAMDLLIATAAVVAGAALVTGNAKHFSRIPDLAVLTY